MRRFACLIVLLVITTPLLARPTPAVEGGSAPAVAPAAGSAVMEDPLERRTLEIAKDLRCTVCQNQPVAESNADLARDMRALIREQLQAGRSREEIMNYFVERYGDYVLLKPPYERTGTILWIGPPVLLLLLAVLSWFFIRRHTRQATPPAPTLSEEDQARIRAARLQD